METAPSQRKLTETANELVRLLEQATQPPDALFIALLKSKCVSLYEQVLLLEQHAGPQAQPVAPPAETVIKIHADEIRPIIEEQAHSIETNNEPVALAEVTPDVSELKPVDSIYIQEEIASEVTRIETKEPELPFEPTESAEILLHEKLSSKQDQPPGLAEQFSTRHEHSVLAEKLQQKVESLKSAISLNKKIAFVNQLFQENTVEYAKAIDRLNNAATLDEALRYFNELKHQYQWSNDQELVKDLQSLIEKRYGKF